MVQHRPWAIALCALTLCTALGACSDGGDSDDDEIAAVRDLFTDDASVPVGDDVDLNISFSFARETVVDDNRNVSVVVRVPNGLVFVPGTGRVELRGDDRSVTPSTETCADGQTFHRFDLGEGDLDRADDPAGPGDGRLVMALQGASVVGTVTIDAAAEYDFQPGSCAEGLVPEDATTVTVVP